VLLAFTLVAGVSQMLWLNYAPVLAAIEADYQVSELVASTLILVFPALYVVLSLPAGALIDRRGYRVVVGAGAIAQAAFACLRLADASFWTLVAAQLGIAAAQPFVVNGVSKLVADWFPPEQGAIATGVATMGMFVGMAGAMAGTPPLAEAFGMRGAMAVFAAIAVASGAVFVAVCREQHPRTGSTIPARLRDLMSRDLLLVFAISFLGLGYFNGLTTWLEELVAPNGLDAVDAGVLGGAVIVAGIVGAAVIPALSDRLARRKPFVIGCTAVALALTLPLCSLASYPAALAVGAALGFAFLPAYALLLEMSAELAGADAAGLATGMLMLTGNAGAVVVVLLVPIAQPHGAYLLAGTLVVAVVLAAIVPETAKPNARA
jgi:predicted MFS family arabinose efflux permease